MKRSLRSFHFLTPKSSPCRATRGNDSPHDKRKEISLPHIQLQQIASSDSQETEENSNQEIIKIASVPLGYYKEDEISLEVDSEKAALHGLHLFEREKGFIASEFKRFFKLPEGVDPATVTASRSTKHGDVLIIEGMKYSERRVKDNKFDFRDFKAEEIKIQLRKDKLNVTGKSLSKDHPSTSRGILLPVDADPGSVTSHLSKKSLLSEATSMQRETVKVTMKTSEPCDERSTVELFALVV